MANDLATLQVQGRALPAAFQGQKAAAIFQGQEYEKASDGIDSSYGVLKLGGKVWSLAYKGQTLPFIRPDDGTARGAIDVVIVRAGSVKAKTYYEKYTDGSRDKPICWSDNGITPDRNVAPTQRQSAACAVCPKNVFGSRITEDGNEAKACADNKRTAVVLDPKLATEILGSPLAEAILFRLPAASLQEFASFGDSMDRQGFPLMSFVTRLTFDIDKKYPKVKFEAIRPLSPEEATVVLALRDDPSSARIVNDVAGTGEVVEVQEQRTTTAPPPNTGNANAGTAEGAGQVTVLEKPPTENVVQLNVAPRPTALQQAEKMQQSDPGEATTGVVTDFEKDIDAKINALLS